MVAFLDGKEEGFDYFFKLYYKALCFFANRYLNDLVTAEDVVSEGFIQLWNNKEKIESENHLRNYLYRAVYHLCLDCLQKIKTKEKYLHAIKDATQEEENEYSRNVTRSETTRQLEQAIDLLPGQCKRIFHKLYLEGKSVKDVAEELGLSISTINNQKSRGIKILQSRLTGIMR